MKHTRICNLARGLLIALAILAIAWVLRPRSFADVTGMERATDFYITSRDSAMDLLESRPSREEIGPLLALLDRGTLRFQGRQRHIEWTDSQRLYHVYFDRAEEGQWVSGTRFSLRSDGALYMPLYVGDLSLGYTWYQLSGCDMDAVNAELQRLLGMT